ncbi:hypothetical protein Q4485_02745 [Granulosicoccaceae sp. 1_MG-2023]|nr:hypothetical protein [Granulosicoccaceae sp. 1_MG-2023]
MKAKTAQALRAFHQRRCTAPVVSKRSRLAARLVPVLIPAFLLAGCVAPRVATQEVAPEVDTADVAAYPLLGQSQRQIRQDRYECYLWAVEQSGYDPATETGTVEVSGSSAAVPPGGSATVSGTVTGATVGALMSGPHRGGAGVAVGALVGALAGASVDADRQARAEAAENRYKASAVAAENRRIAAYRRALSACLDARGYSVR